MFQNFNLMSYLIFYVLKFDLRINLYGV